MTAHSAAAGVEINAKPGGRQAEILSAEALAFLAGLHRRFNRRRLELPDPTNGAPGRLRRRQAARLSPRDEIDPRRRLEGRADPGRPSRPPGRDHRPGRSQDDRQRAELGREGLHGRFRGRHLADVRQHGRGPGQSQGSLGRKDRLHRSGDRKDLCAQEQSGGADGAPARLAFARAACRRRRRGNVRLAVRLRPLRLPLRQGADGPGRDAGLLSAETREPPRSAALGRGFLPRRAANSARRTDRSRRRC